MTEMTDPEWMTPTPLGQTNYKVDIDRRPTQIRYTPDGMAVYMYLDDPGVYYNDHARRIPMELAAEAGYEIAKNERLHKMIEARRKVMGDLEAQFQIENAHKVIADRGDYQVIQIAPDYCNIVFKDGGDGFVLNTNGPVSKSTAMKRFRDLVGPEEAAEAATSQPVDADVAKAEKKQVK